VEASLEQLLGPVSTRNLLVCFLWVLKSVDSELLSLWWNSLSITRLNLLINVLDLCVSCFEYKVGPFMGVYSLLHVLIMSLVQGKRNLASQTSTTSARNSKGSEMKDMMANAIMGGGGTARERLRQRKGLAREQPQGTHCVDN
jgi:hypothetical protein